MPWRRSCSPEDGVDGFEKGEIAVLSLGRGRSSQATCRRGGDVAVGAGGDVDDDFSGVLHWDSPQGVFGDYTLRAQTSEESSLPHQPGIASQAWE